MRPLGHRALPLLLLLGMALAVVPARGWAQEAERIGTVVAVDGTAEARAANATVWEPLQFRAALFPRDVIRTGPTSKVKVLLRDDSIITLAERSEMEFTEFLLTPQQRRTVLGLFVGKVRVVTTAIFGAGSGTEVRTANTVAGVRGTTFIVIFIPPSTTEVIGLDGVVTVRHLNPAIPQIEPLQQNFLTRVVGNRPPAPAAVLSATERQSLESDLRLIEQVPVEIKPTGEDRPSGTIRGTSGEEGQNERSGALTTRVSAGPASVDGPDPLRISELPAVGGILSRDATAILDRQVERTLTIQNSQSFQPPALQGTSIITPDNSTSVTTLQSTPPQTVPLTVTITIPRN